MAAAAAAVKGWQLWDRDMCLCPPCRYVQHNGNCVLHISETLLTGSHSFVFCLQQQRHSHVAPADTASNNDIRANCCLLVNGAPHRPASHRTYCTLALPAVASENEQHCQRRAPSRGTTQISPRRSLLQNVTRFHGSPLQNSL
jgi:hypothetical protein